MYACFSLPVTLTRCPRWLILSPNFSARSIFSRYRALRQDEMWVNSDGTPGGVYFLLAVEDEDESDLVTVRSEEPIAVGPPVRSTRSACRVSSCVRPPGTSARTTAWPTRGGMARLRCASAYSLSHQLGTTHDFKPRN